MAAPTVRTEAALNSVVNFRMTIAPLQKASPDYDLVVYLLNTTALQTALGYFDLSLTNREYSNDINSCDNARLQ